MKIPNKDIKFPLRDYDRLCFLKNIITNPNIIVGDYTYYDDFESVDNFEKNKQMHNASYTNRYPLLKKPLIVRV